MRDKISPNSPEIQLDNFGPLLLFSFLDPDSNAHFIFVTRCLWEIFFSFININVNKLNMYYVLKHGVFLNRNIFPFQKGKNNFENIVLLWLWGLYLIGLIGSLCYKHEDNWVDQWIFKDQHISLNGKANAWPPSQACWVGIPLGRIYPRICILN